MKKAIIAIMMVALTVSLVSCGQKAGTDSESVSSSSVTSEESSKDEEETDADKEAENVSYSSYEDIIDAYNKAFEEKWDREVLMENSLSPLLIHYYDKGVESVGFNPTTDLNNDGKYDLLIGEVLGNDGNEPNMMIFAAYALTGDGFKTIFLSDERSGYYLTQLLDNDPTALNVCFEGSNSATSYVYASYRVDEDDELEITQGLIYDEEGDPDNPWFLTYDDRLVVEYAEPITQKEFNDIIAANQFNYYFPGYLTISQGYFIPDPEGGK